MVTLHALAMKILIEKHECKQVKSDTTSLIQCHIVQQCYLIED